MADKYRDFQEIKYPRKLTTEAQRTRRDEEERRLLYEVFGDFLIWKSHKRSLST